MGHHTFDADRAAELEAAEKRYSLLSADELCWAVDPTADDRIADLGSGTGFYTDDIAPRAAAVYAVDLQPEMHDHYREKGVPENVELITAPVDDMPMETDSIDTAFSTMTYHEFASADSMTEICRVLTLGGRLAIADWAANGEGQRGPPLEERYALDDAASTLQDHGFEIEFEAARPETFLLIATAE